jgi:hypothetical protein
VERCLDILSNYPVYIVHPEKMDRNTVQNLLSKGNNVREIQFKARYFKGLSGYNRLMTSLRFYRQFSDYEYLLKYHSDAWVFRDELDYWCDKGYDYIGAPLYEYDGTLSPSKYIGIGNGGFSLQRVSSAIKVLSSWRIIYSVSDLNEWYLKYNWKGRLRYLPYYLRALMGIGRFSHSGFNRLRINEDIFWGIYVPQAFQWYKIAPFEESYKFSMEYNCQQLMALNGGKLPFGCHQWYKGQFYEFWKNYIPQAEKSL